MMIYLALCDDDAVFRLKFKEMLTRVLDNAGIFHHIYEFESGEDLLDLCISLISVQKIRYSFFRYSNETIKWN